VRASSGSRRSVERRVSVALPAFVAGLELTARYPAYLARPDEPLVPGPAPVAIPEGTVILTSGAASVPLTAATWRRDGGARRAGRSRAHPARSGELARESNGEGGGGRARVAGRVGRGRAGHRPGGSRRGAARPPAGRYAAAPRRGVG